MSKSEGRREQNKRRKLENITRAAREVFSTQGFENATMREIAAEAGIGYGTLFLYAPSKEALLVLVFRSELGRVVDDAFLNMPARDIRAQIRHMFSVVISHHEDNPVLFLPFLREAMAVGLPEMMEIREFNREWRMRVATLLEAARERGELADEHDETIVADLILDTLTVALRRWITGGLTREALDAHLDCAIALLCPTR